MIDIYEDNGCVISVSDDYLMHYGRGHLDGGHSGRYPWGSGEMPFQDSKDFLARARELIKEDVTYYDKNTGETFKGRTAVAKIMGLSSGEFRAQYSLAKNEERTKLRDRAQSLLDGGMGWTEVARKMGLPNESSVRSLLKEDSKFNMEKAKNTAEFLKKIVDERGMIDVGKEVEKNLGISRNKLNEAIYLLEREGYVNAIGRIPNPTDPTGAHQTTLSVIAPKGSKLSTVYDYNKINFLNQDDYNEFKKQNNISSIDDYVSKDNGKTFEPKFTYPASMDSSRLLIRYKEDGGEEKDGTIELRPGVPDLSLGNSQYSQVRILVDNEKYLKGMAVYSTEKLPKGIDAVFYSHHSKDEDYNNLKPIKRDKNGNPEDNPFGSAIKEGGQYWYIDKNGDRKLGLINKRADEGDWSDWKDKLPSQFLSKQTTTLAKRQLTLAVKEKKQEYEDIMLLENDTLKKNLLNSFASDCDSAAVHLYAAALPRQKHQVLIAIPSMKDNEVFAPNYKDGEMVALVRYPHAGTFEIPVLRVNNKQEDAIKVLTKNARDCVGINLNVAKKLSGADFDGDSVMVIPTNDKTKISSRSSLPELEDFDPEKEYGSTEVIDKDGNAHYYNKYGIEFQPMSKRSTQLEMGKISNLITDMTIAGATDEEKAKAVKHSMVVIDAQKHKYDYRSSERVNEIKDLTKRYQGYIDKKTGKEMGGASTLISRAKKEIVVDKRQGTPKVNVKYLTNGKENPDYDPSRPEGSLIYKTADDNKLNYKIVVDPTTKEEKTVYERDGKLVYNKGNKTKKDPTTGKTVKVYSEVTNETVISKKRYETPKPTEMEETDDARDLISRFDSSIENLYASYANSMKAMANEARKEAYYTPNSKYSPQAKETYAKEVQELDMEIAKARKNAPRERQAIVIATSRVNAKKEVDPTMTKDELKKLNQRELTKARQEVGAERHTITLTDKQWEAIQAGGLSSAKLEDIFKYTDLDDVRERATPRSRKEVTDALISRIQNYKINGKTNAEIASALGLSATTVSKYTKGIE